MRVKEEAKKAITKKWGEYGHKMQDNNRGNAKLLYKTVKNLKKRQHEQNQLHRRYRWQSVTHRQEILDRWCQHFSNTLSSTAEISNRENIRKLRYH